MISDHLSVWRPLLAEALAAPASLRLCVTPASLVPPVKLFPLTCEYISGEKQFYHRAQRFYQDVPASEEGMMGDFVDISSVDLEGSRQFLNRFLVSPRSARVSDHRRSYGCYFRRSADSLQKLQIETGQSAGG